MIDNYIRTRGWAFIWVPMITQKKQKKTLYKFLPQFAYKSSFSHQAPVISRLKLQLPPHYQTQISYFKPTPLFSSWFLNVKLYTNFLYSSLNIQIAMLKWPCTWDFLCFLAMQMTISMEFVMWRCQGIPLLRVRWSSPVKQLGFEIGIGVGIGIFRKYA